MQQIRQLLRDARQKIPAPLREQHSRQITQRLSRLTAFQRARTIACYSPTSEEVDTQFIIELATRLDKKIFLPIINRSKWRQAPLLFGEYIPTQTPLRANKYGILEPDVNHSKKHQGTTLDFVCVPLVGFNQHCDRIGMGAGYYDKAFAKNIGNSAWRQPFLAGLAFSCQQADFDPQVHDVPLRAVITESASFMRP